MKLKDNITPALNKVDKELNKVLKSASRKIAASGTKAVKLEYRKTGIKHRSKSKYGNPAQGIKGRVLSNPLWVKITVMGDFRLKWFEKGTKQRQTGKGWNRGKMKATPFFAPAINRFVYEVKGIYSKAFEETLKKLRK